MAPGEATLRTPMESGHQRVRRISASVPETVTANWRLTRQQMHFWRSWWKRTLLDGSGYFPCELTDGANIVEVQCRAKESTYTAKMVAGMNWEVSCELEVEDVPIMSEAQMEAYLAG